MSSHTARVRKNHPAFHVLFLLTIFLLATYGAESDKPLYLDPSKPAEARARDLVGRLTLEEKAILLNHNGPDVPRFGIKSDKWNQC